MGKLNEGVSADKTGLARGLILARRARFDIRAARKAPAHEKDHGKYRSRPKGYRAKEFGKKLLYHPRSMMRVFGQRKVTIRLHPRPKLVCAASRRG